MSHLSFEVKIGRSDQCCCLDLCVSAKMIQGLRSIFRTGRTRSLKWRLAQLNSLIKLLDENGEKICQALFEDLHKHNMESYVMEINMCKNDAVFNINNLRSWMQPQQVPKGLLNKMDDAYIRYEPYGTALIIGAWNYPIQVTLLPLIGAIAAGNCVVLKPSELAPKVATLLEELIPKYLDQECIKVVNGGIPETTLLLEQRFDIIFYTGNTTVGRIVMAAASKYVTPVVLELGGKSPVFIDGNADMNVVARRIAWGKFCNAGQTCIAPDYVMCTVETQEKLLDKMKVVLEEFYTTNAQTSESFGRIINARHFQRVYKLMEGANIAIGGQTDESDLFIAPTVLRDVKLTDPVMQEEIFGPLLPIVPVRDHQEAIEIINDREKPLAMYIFSTDKGLVRTIKESTSSGGFCVNDTLIHAAVPTLPFGGVGNSGMGAYHGKFTFDTFSHKRGCLEKSLGLESFNSLRYPPYNEKKLGWLQWILVQKPRRTGLLGFFPFVVLGVFLAVFFKKYSL
ncbi:aldehyde dehydrogenase family 3 member B1-like isoform X4 [Pomacea canaliculata]|uniref:aldehyde dehydrogenase family 3 member B1-like isoform X4 n=1 Tax=Pomacea canaliculata TaxID=400727 RepID=UPI000D7309CF|nr:aldehyde dehydrogenase family 3 member B1-like isoform X4 [Pomacea canaliculata]